MHVNCNKQASTASFGRMRRYARSEGASGFASQQLAQQLWALAFSSYGVQLPAQGQLLKTITVYKAAKGEEVGRAPHEPTSAQPLQKPALRNMAHKGPCQAQ